MVEEEASQMSLKYQILGATFVFDLEIWDCCSFGRIPVRIKIQMIHRCLADHVILSLVMLWLGHRETLSRGCRSSR